MALLTVRQMLVDVARPILVSGSTDPALGAPEQNNCLVAITTIDGVVGDLNANNIIPNTGRRNADVTSLRDQCVAPIRALSNARPFFQTGGQFIYDALDAMNDALQLIAAQVGSTEVTYS